MIGKNIRTATKINTIVVGGFSKLLKYFKNNFPGTIISYVDCNYFYGNSYLNNGFTLKNYSEPNYFYFKKHNLIYEHRSKYQKHKLSKILPIYDSNMNEYENMLKEWLS